MTTAAALTANPAMAAAMMIPQLFGGQQVGPAAPAFNVGRTAAAGALSPQLASGGLGGLLSNVAQQTSEEPSVRQRVEDIQKPKPDFFSGFFNNLDQGFQSPSRMIGLGLLNQIDPRLAMGGAAVQGLGLLGGKRLF